MKKTFAIIALLITSLAIFTSCQKDEQPKTMLEIRWIEGKYTGTYETSLKIYHNCNLNTPETDKYSSKKCNVKVTLNEDSTLTILIRGEYNSTLENMEFTVSNDNNTIKCGRYTFEKSSQRMYYYNFENAGFNNGTSYQESYERFSAYKDFE